MNISFPAAKATSPGRAGVVNVLLGPTNTGKTHYAIERMLSYSSGMIGLPLRLLAREVYNRAVEKAGGGHRRAHYRRGKNQAGIAALLRFDRRGDAA